MPSGDNQMSNKIKVLHTYKCRRCAKLSWEVLCSDRVASDINYNEAHANARTRIDNPKIAKCDGCAGWLVVHDYCGLEVITDRDADEVTE